MMAQANSSNYARKKFATFNEMRKPSFLANESNEEDDRKAKEILFLSPNEQERFEDFNFSVPSVSK